MFTVFKASCSQNRIIERLVELASESPLEFKHCAALVKGRKIVDMNRNVMRFRINGQNVSTVHAEVNVLQRAVYNISKNLGNANQFDKINKIQRSLRSFDLWVIRVAARAQDDKTLTLASSSPCQSCVYALKKYGIRKVFFSTGNMNEVKCIDVRNTPIDFFYQTARQRKYNCVHSNWELGS